ncbi:MAG: sugar phosphate isomerase/epimerase [Ignavibacteriales bacterium]|nr:sugar phosphate isomerase/epimerase [Ignavibacteriales bacterium]
MYNKKIICCYLYPITKYGYPPPAENTNKYLEEMHALGFTSVEIEGIREPHLLQVYEQRDEIKKKLDKLKLNVPYFCAVLPELSSMDENIRNHNIELFEKGCEIASLFNAKGILDNAPIPPYEFPKGIPILRHYSNEVLNAASYPADFSWQKFWDGLIPTFKTLCDIADKYNLTYQLHPATGVITDSAETFLDFYNAVNKENLKFNLDTANLFAHSEDPTTSLKRIKDHVSYIHLSDNRGSKVEHLAVGKGKINWKEFLKTLHEIEYDGDIGIDIGGEESIVDNLDDAYKNAAEFLESNWLKTKAPSK